MYSDHHLDPAIGKDIVDDLVLTNISAAGGFVVKDKDRKLIGAVKLRNGKLDISDVVDGTNDECRISLTLVGQPVVVTAAAVTYASPDYFGSVLPTYTVALDTSS